MTNKRNIYEDVPALLSVKVMDIDEGFKTYDEVRLVRIKSKNYTLLIMRNFTPTIGDIYGNVDILLKDREVSLKDIKAFYNFQNNELFLLICSKPKENND